MNQKTALVVDDSKTHRFVLKRMLELHGLTVDTADSAEAGLEHLSVNLPDIIFMDHMMPGMDGLQAVSIIKDDPRTAMIPIVMYTSREGEVYVGQARALGAVDVLPKEVEAGEILDVLKRLNLVNASNDAGISSKGSDGKSKASKAMSSFTQGLSDKEIRQLAEAVANAVPSPDLGDGFAKLLNKQRRDVKHDIQELVQNANRALVDEIAAQQKPLTDNSDTNYDSGFVESKLAWLNPKLGIAFVVGIVFYALLSALIFGGDSNSSATSEDMREQVQVLQDKNDDLEAKLLDGESGGNAIDLNLVETIEWLTNRRLSYGFGETALNDKRAAFFQKLFDRLNRAGFKGKVHLAVHVGNFCLVNDKQGRLVLPKSRLALAKCTQTKLSSSEAKRQGKRQSLEFVHFAETHPALESGDIRLIIKSMGNEQPVKPSPSKEMIKTAGEWNSLAADNNRLTLTLSSDE